MATTFNKGEKFMLFVYGKKKTADTFANWYSVADATSHDLSLDSEFVEVKTKDNVNGAKIKQSHKISGSAEHYDSNDGAGLNYSDLMKLAMSDNAMANFIYCKIDASASEFKSDTGHTPGFVGFQFMGTVGNVKRNDKVGEVATFSYSLDSYGDVLTIDKAPDTTKMQYFNFETGKLETASK